MWPFNKKKKGPLGFDASIEKEAEALIENVERSHSSSIPPRLPDLEDRGDPSGIIDTAVTKAKRIIQDAHLEEKTT